MDQNINEIVLEDKYTSNGDHKNEIMGNKSYMVGEKYGAILCHSHTIACITIVLYIAMGVLFYQDREGWSVIDCVYFSMVIITTVGYGDIYPTDTASKWFTMGFAILGIGGIGFSIGSLADGFVSRHERHRKNKSKKVLRRTSIAASNAFMEKNNPLGWKSQLPHVHCLPKKLSNDQRTVVHAVIPISLAVLIGMFIGYMEEWSVIDSLYATVITVSTIGFGDFSPQTQIGRALCIIYLPLAVISVGNAIGHVAELIVKRKVVSDTISMKELIEMDLDGDGRVSQVEYLGYILVKLGKVDKDDILEIMQHFKKLDVDHSGSLDKEDLLRLDRHLHKSKK